MEPQRYCPHCGQPVSPNALMGLCPDCLLKAGADTGAAEKSFVPPTPAELGPQFPQLEIFELLGRGGMGAVYRARQKELDRLVALKILPPQAARDPGFADRFTREAKALARLNHPNIVTIYEFGQTNGIYWVMMEYVDGLNLRQLLRAQKLDPKEAIAIVPQICDALQFAHDEGIVHRDIKPENILLDKKGRVKIADFGLAKILGKQPADLTITGTGEKMGTPHYMAPEQVEKPQTVDHRADIYSLGVVFYEMLTGELPLGKFAPPSRVRRIQIDVRLDEVVLRALEKEPELRYQQASELKTGVETIVTTPSSGGDSAPLSSIDPWLELVDTGEYANSWVASAPYFQGKISKEEWVKRLEKVRHPLGNVQSRKLNSMMPSLEGARCEAKYDTTFEHMPVATETVTFAKQPTGEWKAIGYLIRPETQPRFSRLAILGAIWAAVGILGLLLIVALRN